MFVKKLFLYSVLGILLLPLIQVMIPQLKIRAANTSFTWINRATIMRDSDKVYFVDPDISDDTHQYFEQLPASDTSGCKSMLDVVVGGNDSLSAPGGYRYYAVTKNNNQINKSCDNGDYKTVTQDFPGDAFGNPPAPALYIYYWKDKNTIVRLNAGSVRSATMSLPSSTYTIVGKYNASGTNTYRESGDCPDEISVSTGSVTNGTFIARSTSTGSNAVNIKNTNGMESIDAVKLGTTKTAEGCYEGRTTVVLTMQQYAKAEPDKGNPVAPGPGAGTGGNDATSTNDGCYQALPAFGWILCGVIDLADTAYSTMRSYVFDLLNIPSAKINSSSQLKSTWSVMKNLATAGLVLVALVMVASQIFSFDFISAYTVKKVLPRLIIATIAMQFSWFIFTMLIQISNAVGVGIYQLLTNAFGATDIIDILGTKGAGTAVGANAITIIGAIGAAAGVAFVIASSAYLTIVIAMFGVLISILVAIFTLIVRQMLIVILLVLSPLALLAWILPGTQNLWQTWWKLFSRLLAMYPLIAILFAAGAIGAKTAIQFGVTDGSNGTLALIMAIVMYFAPLFLVPSTFKFAGGMFSSIVSGMDRLGKRASGSGFFGLRNRAKIARDNSAWELSKKSRDSARAHNYQEKYARGLTGSSSRYSMQSAYKRLSGIDEHSRQRAEASAAASIIASEEQKFKDRTSLAAFQVKQLVDADMKANSVRYMQNDDGSFKLDDRGQRIEMTRYDREKQFRSDILQTAGESTFTSNGVSIQTGDALREDVAIQALKNKDGSAGIQSFINNDDNFRKLKDYGTENAAAWSVLAEKLPTAAKGASSAPIDDVLKPGFADAVKGFAGLAGPQQEQVISGIAAYSSKDANAVATMLTDLARNTQGVDQTHFAAIKKEFEQSGLIGVDLGLLRNNPNATISFNSGTGQYEIK